MLDAAHLQEQEAPIPLAHLWHLGHFNDDAHTTAAG
jgi:hypothetical protein